MCVYVFMCMHSFMCHGACVEAEGNFVESVLSFYLYVSSGDSTQVTCISQRSQRNRSNGMND